MQFEQMEVEGTSNLVYLIADENVGEAAVIDPSGAVDEIMAKLKEWDVTLKYVIHTHGHGDHTGGTKSLLSKTGARLVAHPGGSMTTDIEVRNNERLLLGEIELVFLYTPGHSYDSMCIVADKYLFTGDTLFIDDCGYAEQVGGNSFLMWESIFNKITKLSDDFIICPGHDQKQSPKKMDTLGNQRETNECLKSRNKEEFRDFMLHP